MDTIIVTGGAGFIGSNFVRLALRETEARVVVIDKLTYAGNLESLDDVRRNPRFNFVQGDIADRSLVDRLYTDHHPTWVVNFAAESHVDRSIDGPRAFIETNIVGTFELLDAARLYVRELAPEARDRFRFCTSPPTRCTVRSARPASSTRRRRTHRIRRTRPRRRAPTTWCGRIARRTACRR
jgi:dTDP-glucose 4,6-dehydratase